MTVLLWTLGFLFFVFVLMVSVILHELGHYSVAKAFKLKVPKFSMGFGKPLFSFNKWGTKWSLAPIFLGGFVQIDDPKIEKPNVEDLEKRVADETLSDEERKSAKKELKKRMNTYIAEKGLLSYVEPWKRILIYLAGPAVNLVLGIAILYGVLMGFPSLVINNTIDTVNQCENISQQESCEAGKAGVQPGDTILAINGNEVRMTEDLYPYLQGQTEVDLTVQRNDEILEITSGVKNDYLGVNLTPDYRPLNFVESTETMKNVVMDSLIAVSKIPEKMPAVAEQTFYGGERDPEAPSSIVHAGKTYGDTSADMEIPTKSKIHMLLTYSGILNLSLAIVNLIPIGVLDGSRVVFAIIDQFKIWFSRIMRKKYNPLSEWEITVMSVVGTVAIFLFMGMLILSDVVNIIRGQI